MKIELTMDRALVKGYYVFSVSCTHADEKYEISKRYPKLSVENVGLSDFHAREFADMSATLIKHILSL